MRPLSPSHAAALAELPLARAATALGRPPRLPFAARVRHWAAAPLHDFPIREHLLFRYSSLPGLLAAPRPGRRWRILEAGPGGGFAAHLLAGRAELTLVEAPGPAAEQLARRFAGVAGVRVWHLDLEDEAAGPVPPAGGEFDFAFALDMFEYAAQPERVLRLFAAWLRPGAELFLTFPNLPPPRGDGRCWFPEAAQLEALLAAAGFLRWEILAVALRRWPRSAYWAGHDGPLVLLRRFRRPRFVGPQPRRYDKTWAFAARSWLEPTRWPLHLWWAALARILASRGPLFSARPAAGQLLGQRLVVRAWRGR